MPRPDQITDHSDKALERLPDKFRGKTLITALFRSKSAARVNVVALEASSLYSVTVNGDNVDYTSGLFDTKAEIAEQLVIEANSIPTLDATASILTTDDEFIYVSAKTTGAELTITTSSNLSWTNIGLIDQVQELENVLFDLLNNRMLDAAEGAQLDKLGSMLNESRKGSQSDSNYRTILGVKIKQNLSQGEPETLISILSALTSSTQINFVELYPAAIVMYFDGEIIGTPSDLKNLIDGIAAGGVRVDIVKGLLTEAFVVEGAVGLGCSSTVSPTTGGRIASSKGL